MEGRFKFRLRKVFVALGSAEADLVYNGIFRISEHIEQERTRNILLKSCSMDANSEPMKDLARSLLAAEAASHPDVDSQVHEALRVLEKLRISLTRFAGPDGFTALMRRALAMARGEVSSLQSVNILSDGSIKGLDEVSANSMDLGVEATVVITANLLTLLVTFIGEPLTIRLISDAWPDASMDR